MAEQKRLNMRPTTTQKISNVRWVNGFFSTEGNYFSSGGWETYKKEEVRTTAGNGAETKGDTELKTEEREPREERADTSTKDQSKMESANTMEVKDSTDGQVRVRKLSKHARKRARAEEREAAPEIIPRRYRKPFYERTQSEDESSRCRSEIDSDEECS